MIDENIYFKKMFKLGVFAIIFNDKKEVLLCHRRDYDLWNLPGGGLEKNESPWDGILREVREEVGLKIKIDRLLGVYHKPQKNECVFSFSCLVSGGEITLSDEADEIEFFSRSRLPTNISLKQKERILDAFDNLEEVVLKSQDSTDYIDLK